MFEQFQHLLPRSRAWDLIVDKPLRRLFRALGTTSTDAVVYVNAALADVLPAFTRRLTQWEQQFNLPDTGLTEQQRRDRLTAAWRRVGGQSPGYIQDTLQAAGFPVFVHEWWVPGSDPVQARSPLTVVRDDGTAVDYLYELDTTGAELGTTDMELGQRSGAVGYLLVNKIYDATGMRVQYRVPRDPTDWPFVLYIGGRMFPDSVTLTPARRDEFEELLLSIAPGQQWLGVLVEYGAI